ncbi:MAG TPA: energy-coupling factor transporter transmembrane component T [Bacteroidales bacterium]|nr:energy-coupling factor transporter transmembrane component T [Bacteroidales bacterium]HPT11517.1 energy-coupling factor transporter transmembrane component T [Bacteroidales bacterium]
MNSPIPEYLLGNEPSLTCKHSSGQRRISFIDKTLSAIAKTVKNIYLQAESASGKSFIYRINPYFKFISLVYIAIMLSLTTSLKGQAFATAFTIILFILAGIKVFDVFRKTFAIAFLFGFLIALPASLNIVTKGTVVLPLISLSSPKEFWIYSIPQVIGITDNGIRVVSLIFLRILNTVSFTLLIVFTTPLPSLIKSFKIIGVPDTFLLIITLTYKYIFILTRTIEETYLSLKSRLTTNVRNSEIHNVVGSRIFFIFKKSARVYENTYLAMVSRGYGGDIKLLSDIHFLISDFVFLVVIVLTGIILTIL